MRRTPAPPQPRDPPVPTQPANTDAAPLTWTEFERVELRVGTILEVIDFPEARRPAWRLRIDFGPHLGERLSSAQITDLYDRPTLVGRQVLAVVNFPPKQIGRFMSQVLVTGVPDEQGRIVLVHQERPVPNGTRLI